MFNAQDTVKRKRKESREGARKMINRDSAVQFNDIYIYIRLKKYDFRKHSPQIITIMCDHRGLLLVAFSANVVIEK